MKISIVVPISRPHFVDLVKENLSKLAKSDYECELVVLVDNPRIGELSFEGFNRVTIERIPPVPKIPSGNTTKIRNRIAEIRNVSRETVGDTDFVFSFEDDTVLPKQALTTLVKSFNKLAESTEVGLVSGVQVGRHGARIIGAFRADSLQFPEEFTTIGKEELRSTVEVDGAGMYCYLTTTKLYKEAKYGWEEPVGPDIWYGMLLRLKGLRNFLIPEVTCGHRVGGKEVSVQTLVPDHNTVKARFYKHRGSWNHEIVG